jgi:cell division septal protein FtsQ
MKSIKYNDGLAKKRRQAQFAKLLMVLGVVLLILVALGFVLFFSNNFEVNNIQIQGNQRIKKDSLMEQVAQQLGIKRFKFFSLNKNIFFFNSDQLKSEIMSAYEGVEEIEIEKNIPHDVVIKIKERDSVGVWCFQDGCHYFDDQGVTWGSALESSGSLIVTVKDPENKEGRIDKDLLATVRMLTSKLKEIGVPAKVISKEVGAPKDLRVSVVPGYDLLFNLNSNMEDQIQILRVFLKDKSKDLGFNPQYLDLRLNGRVYYKTLSLRMLRLLQLNHCLVYLNID